MVEQSNLILATIAPIVFFLTLLTDPYLAPAAAYTLLSEIAAVWRWDSPLVPVMTWLRETLFEALARVGSLVLLDMADHITVVRHRLQNQMVLRSPQSGSRGTSPHMRVHRETTDDHIGKGGLPPHL